jgi:hypothetical protein
MKKNYFNSRNLINIFLISLVLSSGIVGCDFRWEKYYNREKRFVMLLPRTWVKVPGSRDTAILVKDNLRGPKDRFRENINVVVNTLPKTVTLEVFFEANKYEIEFNLPGVYNISEGEMFSGMVPGRWISFNQKIGDMALKVISASWIRDGRVYVVTCVCDNQYAFQYDPLFQKVIKSFRIK